MSMNKTYKEDPISFLSTLFKVAVAAAMPNFKELGLKFPTPKSGKIVVIGAGKGAAAMAKSFEQAAKDFWSTADYERLQGLVVTRYGHGLACEKVEVIEASHPVPDKAGQIAAQRILGLISNLSADDLVVFLASGGGSALLTAPIDGITLDEKMMINKELLKCGASIFEINCVRKHLSKIKGGRLAQLCHPAQVLTYAISDIPGDDPSIIASGPTLPDSSTCEDALRVITKYDIQVPGFIRESLKTSALETPKVGDPLFSSIPEPVVLTTAKHSLEAAKRFAEESELNAEILSDSIEGEAQQVGAVFGAMSLWLARKDSDSVLKKPLVLISGGETTVTVKGNGSGGRNTDFLLSFAHAVHGAEGIYAIAADTDGIDGSEDNAGATYSPKTIQKGHDFGMNLVDCLNKNDSYTFFGAAGDLLVTGPTRTNVNDFRAILII